jgi:hypothetical protein
MIMMINLTVIFLEAYREDTHSAVTPNQSE